MRNGRVFPLEFRPMASKIFTTDLKVGMFVADLDRPWVDTPFLLQGFVIEDKEQIATLRAHCEFVIIDRARSLGDQFEAPAVVAITPPAPGSRTPTTTTAAAAAKPAVTRDAPIPAAPPRPRPAPAREGRVLRLEDVTRRAGSRTHAPTGNGDSDD